MIMLSSMNSIPFSLSNEATSGLDAVLGIPTTVTGRWSGAVAFRSSDRLALLEPPVREGKNGQRGQSLRCAGSVHITPASLAILEARSMAISIGSIWGGLPFHVSFAMRSIKTFASSRYSSLEL